MRKFCVWSLLVLGLLTIVTGIVEAQAWHRGNAEAHIAVASLFVLICLVHVVVNRKAVMRYIRSGK